MEFRTVSLAAQGYSNAKGLGADPVGQPADRPAETPGQKFSREMQRNEATVMANMVSGADPHALVQALAETELAVETAVTVRNKVVEAYQEILRMPV